MTEPLVDPGQAFLSGNDPTAFLQDNLPVGDSDDHHHAKIAVGIAAAFLIYVALAKTELKNESNDDPNGALLRIWRRVAPLWLRAAVPAILEAYQLGNTGNLTSEEMEQLATDYAGNLGEYLHETSANALVEGFQAQLAKGWSREVAWNRAADAYGADGPQMRTYVTMITQKTDNADAVEQASRATVDKMVLNRADRMGDTEAWHAMQTGKMINWMVAEKLGNLPEGCKKRWITAKDERVCPICAPLHLTTVPLDERFETPAGQKLWAPGVHPRCRCVLALVYPEWEVVNKNAPGDPYDRDRRGRFSTREQRQAFLRNRVQTMERPIHAPPVVAPQVIPDEKEQINPFADTNPFKTNPFARATTANPFAANPFAATAANPFAPNPFAANPFGGNPTRGARKLVIIVVNGVPTEVEAEEAIPQPPGPGRQIMALVDEYHMAWWELQQPNRTNIQGEEFAQPPLHRKPNGAYEQGDVINFDEWAHERRKITHVDEKFPGIEVTSARGIGPVMEALRNYYSVAGLVETPEQEEAQRAYEDAQHEFWGDILDNAMTVVQTLDYEDLQEIYRGAGMQYQDMDTEEMRDRIVQAAYSVYEPPENADLLDSYQNYMEETQPSEALQDAHAARMHSGMDVLAVPEVFSFPDGFVGDWTLTGTPLIRGRYVVKRVVTHALPPSPEMGGFAVPAYREVQLQLLDATGPDSPGRKHE